MTRNFPRPIATHLCAGIPDVKTVIYLKKDSMMMITLKSKVFTFIYKSSFSYISIVDVVTVNETPTSPYHIPVYVSMTS